MKTPFYLWATELVSQFIEGASDSFLIIAGGSAVTQAGAAAVPAVTPKQLAISVLLGGCIYAASYLKKNPLPSRLPAQSSAQPPVSPS